MEPAKRVILTFSSWAIGSRVMQYLKAQATWVSLFCLSAGLYFALMPNFDHQSSKSLPFLLLYLIIGWLAFRINLPLAAVSCLGSGLVFGLVLLPKLATRVHTLGSVSTFFMQAWFRVAGMSARVDGSVLHFLYGREWNSFRVSPNWLGLWPFLLCSSLVLPLVLMSGNPIRRYLVRILICMLVVLPAFAIGKALLISDVMDPRAMANPLWDILLIAICSAVLSSGISIARKSISLNRKTLAASGVTLIGFTLLLVGIQATFIGTRVPLRVLVDNAHGEWAPTDVVMDEVHFGRSVTYTYSNLVDILSYYGHVATTDQPLSSQGLADYNVLVLKTPTIPFQQSEKEAIWEYVHNGGGLLVLGDHTNLFGMSTYLNEVLKPYRISFNYDGLFDVRTGGFNTWVRHDRETNPMNIVMPASMRFETGASIRAPFYATDLLTLRWTGAEPLDWSNPGFFGNIRYETDESYGAFLSAVMVNAGKGRVIAFSDSTMQSNFSLFFPGRREFTLTCFDLLSRATWGGSSLNLVFIGLGSAITGQGLRRIKDRQYYVFALLGMATLMAMGISALHYSSALNSFLPEKRIPNIVFYGGQGEGGMNWGTALGESNREFPTEYSTFYVASQRVGFFPMWSNGNDVLQDVTADAIVIMDCDLLSSQELVSHLRDQLVKGVNILLVRTMNHATESILPLLENINGGMVQLSPGPVAYSSTVQTEAGGRIVVFEDMNVLSRSSLGKVDAIPTEEQLEGYAVAFALYRALLEKDKTHD